MTKEIDAAIEALEIDQADGVTLAEERKIAAALAGLRSLKQEPFINWESLRDPVTLHVNLLRGIPAKLTEAQLRHLIGEQAQPAPEQTKQVIENFDELKHTPAHWQVFNGETADGAPFALITGGSGPNGRMDTIICEAPNSRDFPKCFAAFEQNGALIAAAPKLLEALKKIATVNAMDYEYQAWASAAIAQADHFADTSNMGAEGKV